MFLFYLDFRTINGHSGQGRRALAKETMILLSDLTWEESCAKKQIRKTTGDQKNILLLRCKKKDPMRIKTYKYITLLFSSYFQLYTSEFL